MQLFLPSQTTPGPSTGTQLGVSLQQRSVHLGACPGPQHGPQLPTQVRTAIAAPGLLTVPRPFPAGCFSPSRAAPAL